MTKYIQRNEFIRCEITNGENEDFVLQIQVKRKCWFFSAWVNTGRPLQVSESSYPPGDFPRLNPRIGSYDDGSESETWDAGTLNLVMRAESYINDYINRREKERKRQERIIQTLESI